MGTRRGSAAARCMSAEAVRAEAVARLRRMGNADGIERARPYWGRTGGGWRMDWSDGYVAVLSPAGRESGAPLPDWLVSAMTETATAPVRYRPHTGIARAAHIIGAVARGLASDAVEVAPRPDAVDLHYRASDVVHTARAWAEADVTVREGADLEAARSLIAIRYACAAWWADQAEWTASRLLAPEGGTTAALVLASPEVRVIIAEMRA